jgi:hypothetical protein
LQECEARSTNSKSAYSHDTIKVSLESEYDAKDALIKNTGEKVMTNDSASHLSIEKIKIAVTQRVHTPTAQ